MSSGLLERRLAEELLLTEKNELIEGGSVFFARGSCLSLMLRAADIAVLVVGSDMRLKVGYNQGSSKVGVAVRVPTRGVYRCVPKQPLC